MSVAELVTVWTNIPKGYDSSPCPGPAKAFADPKCDHFGYGHRLVVVGFGNRKKSPAMSVAELVTVWTNPERVQLIPLGLSLPKRLRIQSVTTSATDHAV